MPRREGCREVVALELGGLRVYAERRVACGEPGPWRRLDRAPWDGGEPQETLDAASGARRLCPVAPTKILAVARNYRAHAREMQGAVPAEPLFFFKPPSSLVGPGDTVLLPPESAKVEHEVELGVVIGKRGRRIPVSAALEHVFGLTLVCDVTARDLQRAEPLWTRAKGFDTFCPVGPAVVTGLGVAPRGLSLTVNGVSRQAGTTADMVFGIAELIAAASAFVTLEPGDLIATGTPEGVGPLVAGDAVVCALEGVGELAFTVALEAPEVRGEGARS